MFIAIPVGMNYRTERMPVVTFTLIGINTLVWVVSEICSVATDGASQQWIFDHLWLVPADFTWHAALTSMFVHAGFFHLFGNMLFLFLFGSCVEDLVGRLRFAISYLVCGLIADFVYVAMSPMHFQSVVPMGGASGAISACLGMYLLLRAGAEIEFKYFFWFFLVYVRTGNFEVPAWVAITLWFGKDLLFAVLGMFDVLPGGGGVAFGAHVGGFAGGLAAAAIFQWMKHRGEARPEPTKMVIEPAAALAAARRVPAPIRATGETPTIFLHDGQQQTGPFTLSAVQAMLERGEINTDASYWSEGMSDWQSVTDLSSQPM
jgi:membrane associated rhomboid family serine protease